MIFDLYEFDASNEYIERFIYPCCCFINLQESNFFKFINFFDLVYTIAVFAFNFVTYESTKIFKTVSLSVSTVWFLLSFLSLVIYCKAKNYGSTFHTFYAVSRIFFCAVILMGLGAAIERDYNNMQQGSVEFDFSAVIKKIWKRLFLTIPMQLFNLHWSFLLYLVVVNRVEVNRKLDKRMKSLGQLTHPVK